MTKDQLVSLIERAGLEAYSYSGRFMFGKHCVAVNGDGIAKILSAIMMATKTAEEIEAFGRMVEKVKSDDMGLGKVLYWPSIEW